MESFKGLEKALEKTNDFDIKDEFEISAKILFNKIVKDHNFNPIYFYVNEKNLQNYLSQFEKIPNDYSKKLFLEFSPEQRTNLDFNYFIIFFEKIINKYFPVFYDLNLNSKKLFFGNPMLLEKILNSLLLIFHLNNKFAEETEKIISDRVTKNTIELIYEDSENPGKASIFQNYSNYQTNLVDLLDMPLPDKSQILSYLKDLKKYSIIFTLTNSPSHFCNLAEFSKIFFNKFLALDILNYISNLYNPQNKDELYLLISDIFLIFLNTFKFHSNFAFYNEVMFSLFLPKDYIQNFIINLNNMSLNILNDGGYFQQNEKHFLHLINIAENIKDFQKSIVNIEFFNTIMKFLNTKNEEDVVYKISLFFNKVDFSAFDNNCLKIAHEILVFINENFDGIIYVNSLKALKQMSLHFTDSKFFEILEKFDLNLQKEKSDLREMLSFLLFISSNEKLNFFLFYRKDIYQKIKNLTFRNFEIGLISLQLLKKGISVIPDIILQNNFFYDLLFFLTKNFELNFFYFFLDFFYEVIQFHRLSLLILIENDLMLFVFEFVKCFNMTLQQLKNKLDEEEIFYANLIFITINKILNLILRDKIRKEFYLRYIKDLFTIEIIENIEDFVLYGINNKLSLGFINDYFFEKHEEGDRVENLISYLHFYIAKNLEKHLDIMLFSKVVNMEKFYIFQKSQYTSLTDTIYKKENYFLNYKIYLEMNYPKGDYDLLQMELKENYSQFKIKTKEIIIDAKYFEVFYEDKMGKLKLIENESNYLELLYQSLQIGKINDFVIEIDLIVKNIVEGFLIRN